VLNNYARNPLDILHKFSEDAPFPPGRQTPLPDRRMVVRVHRELQHYDTQTYRLTRQGPAPPERELALQRSKPFGAAMAGVTADKRCVTLLTVRDAAGLASYVVTPSGVGANHVVNALASAVAPGSGGRAGSVGEE